MSIPDFVGDDLQALGFEVPDATLDQLEVFLDRLLEANTRMNLTAVRQRDAAWKRLIVDSLTVLPGLDDLEPGAKVIDIGSGGGLPGIPLAIARPDLVVTLLESTGKKVAFHREAIDAMGLSQVHTIQERAEVLGQDPSHRQQYDAAVSRAVGPMAEVLEYSLPLVRVGGRMLAMKGPKAGQELDAASDALATLGAGDLQVFDAYPESFDNDLVIVSVLKDRPTPRTYPRSAGIPHRCPL